MRIRGPDDCQVMVQSGPIVVRWIGSWSLEADGPCSIQKGQAS